uniref:non-specific serine/threonine protein kinase n=1 Tax=Knipowitschia caucasica TaxID=637954 RepID=A0AAV2MAQ2_KNICA
MAGFKRGYDGKIAGLYDLDKTLGRGHFAVVKLARHVFTGEKVAVKVIDKTKLDTVATGHLFQEVRCMKLVQHPNIVRLYEVIDTQTKLYLILELGDGGDMFDYIMKHEEAPEILLGDEYDAPAVDIWSLGVILFMLVCGQPPFQEANDSETLTMIMDCKYTVPVRVSSTCKDLIDRMLQRDPKRRASLEEIETHPWLQGVDPSPATKFNTPLVSHKNLSEEEHNSIIQRMVLGDIADRETIVEALETNKYNHITATYYLLAERILREKQEKEVQPRSSSPSNLKAHFRQSWPTRVDMHQDIEVSLAASSISHGGGPQSPARSAENLLNGHRSKGLLELGRREDTTDSVGQGATAPPAPGLGSLRAPAPSTSSTSSKQRACLFRVEEDEEEEDDPTPLPSQVVLRRKPPSITNRLTSRKSAPVLNQIFEEEGESDDDFDMDEGLPPKLSRLRMNMSPGSGPAVGQGSPGAPQKRYHRRKSQGRGSSCSSSETSDDDSESHRRRLDKDSGLGWNRRDSSEGPPGSQGGSGGSGSGGPSGEGGGSSDTGGSPGGGGGDSGTGGGGPAGGSKGQHSPSSCCNNSSFSSPAPTVLRGSRGSVMESLKLMSLCLSSQLQRGRSHRGVTEAQNIIKERSAWRMCFGSTGSLDTITLPTTAASCHHSAPRRPHTHSTPALKNGVLQLPLCEKTISVNIQHGPRDGLLCTSGPASCCQVI